MTRATRGLRPETSHRARSSREARRPSTSIGGSEAGTPGRTTGPESSIQLPRGSTRITRGGIAVETRVLGMRALSAASSRSRPVSSFFFSGDGSLMRMSVLALCVAVPWLYDCEKSPFLSRYPTGGFLGVWLGGDEEMEDLRCHLPARAWQDGADVGQSTCIEPTDNLPTQCYRSSNTLTVITQSANEGVQVEQVEPVAEEAFNAMK